MPSKKVTPVPAPTEPEKGPSLAELARQRPGLVIGGGLLVGLLAGALIPRGAAGKLARGAASAAALGSEVGLALARQARGTARHAAQEASGQLREIEGRASDSARRLGRGTASAAGSAGSTALDLARAGLNLLASLKR